MIYSFTRYKPGYTIVELMVTVLVIAFLSAVLGVFFVKLLGITEQEREEAYVREKLTDICGAYADYLSIASSVSNSANSASAFVATYRQETGGVSLETGRVSQVTHLFSSFDSTDGILNLDIGHYETNRFVSGFSRDIRGDALLMRLTNDIVIVNGTKMLVPLDATNLADAHLVYLRLSARCECESDKGVKTAKNIMVGRIVRLWNRENPD